MKMYNLGTVVLVSIRSPAEIVKNKIIEVTSEYEIENKH